MFKSSEYEPRNEQHSYSIIFKSTSPIESIGSNVFEFTSKLSIYFHSKIMLPLSKNTFVFSTDIKIYGPIHGLTFDNISVSFSPSCVDKPK